ncbi:hypothetical protein GCM10010243_17180 [Streptomyces matensis]|nr:hypothetical protein GCM10010243_17180 [Streptomyces matensis]
MFPPLCPSSSCEGPHSVFTVRAGKRRDGVVDRAGRKGGDGVVERAGRKGVRDARPLRGR